jgi:hypothetical protein
MTMVLPATSDRTSRQLREQRAQWNDTGIMTREATTRDGIELEHGLKRVARPDLALEVSEVRGKRPVASLDLHQEPGRLVPDHDEVNLTLLFVAKVAQLLRAEAEILPSLDSLQQVASDERLQPLTRIVQRGPIEAVPLSRR